MKQFKSNFLLFSGHTGGLRYGCNFWRWKSFHAIYPSLQAFTLAVCPLKTIIEHNIQNFKLSHHQFSSECEEKKRLIEINENLNKSNCLLLETSNNEKKRLYISNYAFRVQNTKYRICTDLTNGHRHKFPDGKHFCMLDRKFESFEIVSLQIETSLTWSLGLPQK